MSTVPCCVAPSSTDVVHRLRAGSSLTTKPANSSDGVT